MDSPLRLIIELKPLDPPVPDILASTTLRYDELTCSGGTLTTAATLSQKEISKLRWYLEEYWQWPYEQFKKRAEEIEDDLADIGKRLYQAVFGTADAQQIVQPWNLQPDADRQISIVSDIPAVLSLPWELLHDERGFLALRSKHPVSIVRQVSQKSAGTLRAAFEPPLRILLVTARPDDTGFVDPRSIARELLNAISEQVEEGTIELEFLRPPTVAQLRKRLSDSKLPPIHILHFDGHGAFGDASIANNGLSMKSNGPQGMLAFEKEDGTEDLIAADALAQVLQDSGVKLAVFNACQSAVVGTDADDVFSSVAARMIQSGIDGVVAMSASVLVAAATRYVKAFYQQLADGTTVPTSQERARQALHDDPRRHLIRRTQDEEGEPVRLLDWWLPHYYQQRPVVFEASKKAKRKKTSRTANAPLLNNDMPQGPRYGFTGRALELLKIERALLQRKLVVISGFGGMGKTALAREAADWFTRIGMYNGACFVSFENGGDATTLLSSVGNFLGINDSKYNPDDSNVALARIKTTINKRPLLVIADNLESILPNGEATLELSLRTQLWNVLLKLREMGVGILLTSRDISFGDAQLAPGKYVMHLPLAGLYHEDAYLLASTLLDALSIDRTRAPYAELRALLHQLDYHPLAIQLVLPQLQHFSIQTIRTEFAALLSKFKDDTNTGRNSSLLAPLDFSLRRLSQEQRDLLPRLSIFEGGAMETDLLVITEISEQVWVSLRTTLEQAALLTVEQVHEHIITPFLRFHPVLVPYLRSQAREEDKALRERYAQRYYATANYYYNQDFQHPEPVRAIVRRELPNLRKALELLLQYDNVDAALSMAHDIISFLTDFGLIREIEQVRRYVARVMETSSKTDADGELTNAEYLHEIGLAEDERKKGNLRPAARRLMYLLARVEATPEGTSQGHGSYRHSWILRELSRCLMANGQLKEAKEMLQKALSIIDVLLLDTVDQDYIDQRGDILVELGEILSRQGKYKDAKEIYEQALTVHINTNSISRQAGVLGELGTLALMQRNFDEARSCYFKALNTFHALGEPTSEAIAWHQLGIVAEEQKQWAEAERCYRESLAIKEQLGDKASVAQTYNQLANAALFTSGSIEAEGWQKRAIQLAEQANPGSVLLASYLSNLSRLITSEVILGHVSKARLVEARHYAEQAKLILERPGVSVEIWYTFNVLACIAELEERPEEARDYRRRERESFAAFAGNRYHIDQQHGTLIIAIAAATRGKAEVRKSAEEILPKYEEAGWHISQAVQRIWAGERDWHSLVEGIDSNSALLILRVLETLQQPPPETLPSSEEVISLEDLIESLPPAILEAMQQGDEAAFNRTFEALSEEEQGRVAAILQVLQEASQEGDDEGV